MNISTRSKGKDMDGTSAIKGSIFDDPFFIGFRTVTGIIRNYTGLPETLYVQVSPGSMLIQQFSFTWLLVWHLVVTFK